jgi:NAD(P)-dependent dehydrogenase (short-subunit alcohol dehydrogenase family)
MSDLTGKVALITGASRGIGAEISKELAIQGAHCILLARTVGALEEVYDHIVGSGGKATIMPMDLLNFKDIDALGPTIAERFGQLDIFVGNAARLGVLSPLGHVMEDEWNKTLDLNLNANFRLIRTLDPLLKNAEKGHVLFVSCNTIDDPQAYWGAYAVSKAGVETMAKAYAKEVEQLNINVNILTPGHVQTELLDEAYPGGYQQKTESVNDVAKQAVSYFLQEHLDSEDVVSLQNS